ncbi:hypothetical protein B0T14DRAFT_495597 [Immersiella caudata]|uniref:Uncharacterized protein n=1 Tax=Immersiella caudata TaxID=314043 RepID=A0AA39WZ39_9PEZI|nr:hypothetical protein B0T14DRAFT_495597 [Immersiella caudata]
MPEPWLLKRIGPAANDFVRRLTEAYSDRCLTSQGDALHAFAGLAAMVKTDTGIDISYGLTWTSLTLAMMWDRKERAVRRSGFPSWSWCGWVGSVRYSAEPSGLFSAWTTRHAWIDWYLYDGEGYFVHVPQKHLGTSAPQPGTSKQLAATATTTAPSVGDDDNPQTLLSTFAKRLDPKRVTPGIRRIISQRKKERTTKEGPFPTAPRYWGLLEAHRAEHPNNTPADISIQTLGVGPEVVLEHYTLYFETLTTTLYISSSEPSDGTENRYFHLFDRQSRRVGIVDLNIDSDIIFNANSINPILTGNAMKPVHVAILSGPSENVTPTTKRLQLEMSTVRLIVRESDAPKPELYQVMILQERKPLKGELQGETRLYERIGIGEVVAVMLERMEDSKWEGILLQ